MKRTRLMNQLTNNENMESSEKTTEQRPIRTLIVEAVGEATARPDTSHLLITVSSQKASVTDAKISVDRRVEYIDQVIHNNQIKDSEKRIFRSVNANEGCYEQSTEIYVTSTDPSKLYEISETLSKKLDASVRTSAISYSLSQRSLDDIRSQSASNAVQNARRKAAEMARLVEGILGSPLSIEQLGSEGLTEPALRGDSLHSQYANWTQATCKIQSNVKITFELKPKRKL